MKQFNGVEVEFTADKIERNTRRSADNSDAIRAELDGLRKRQYDSDKRERLRFIASIIVSIGCAILSFLLGKII